MKTLCLFTLLVLASQAAYADLPQEFIYPIDDRPAVEAGGGWDGFEETEMPASNWDGEPPISAPTPDPGPVAIYPHYYDPKKTDSTYVIDLDDQNRIESQVEYPTEKRDTFTQNDFQYGKDSVQSTETKMEGGEIIEQTERRTDYYPGQLDTQNIQNGVKTEVTQKYEPDPNSPDGRRLAERSEYEKDEQGRTTLYRNIIPAYENGRPTGGYHVIEFRSTFDAAGVETQTITMGRL